MGISIKGCTAGGQLPQVPSNMVCQWMCSDAPSCLSELRTLLKQGTLAKANNMILERKVAVVFQVWKGRHGNLYMNLCWACLLESRTALKTDHNKRYPTHLAMALNSDSVRKIPHCGSGWDGGGTCIDQVCP